MEEKKSILKNWKIWICIFFILIVIAIIGTISDFSKEVDSKNIQQVESEKKEFKNEEILEFAKNEVKKKLRYPDTAKFQKEEIIGKEDNRIVISMYSISEDKNHEEGRIQFVLGIKNSNGKLETFNIATNEETCNTDVAKEFEDLVKEKKYSEIYENLFSTTLKKQLSKSDFAKYNLDLTGSKTEAEPIVDSNNYLKYVTVTIKDKDGQYWIMIIKNGMIYSFSRVKF